jgi:hypothetical protein
MAWLSQEVYAITKGMRIAEALRSFFNSHPRCRKIEGEHRVHESDVSCLSLLAQWAQQTGRTRNGFRHCGLGGKNPVSNHIVTIVTPNRRLSSLACAGAKLEPEECGIGLEPLARDCSWNVDYLAIEPWTGQ